MISNGQVAGFSGDVQETVPKRDGLELILRALRDFRTLYNAGEAGGDVHEVVGEIQQLFLDIGEPSAHGNVRLEDAPRRHTSKVEFKRETERRELPSKRQHRDDSLSSGEECADVSSCSAHSFSRAKPGEKGNRYQRVKRSFPHSSNAGSWMTGDQAFRDLMMSIDDSLARIASAISGYTRLAKSVKPLPFEVRGVQSFDSFLNEFEGYARDKVGNDPNRWLVELRAHLKSDVQRVYDKCYKQGAKYDQVVGRLREWVTHQKSETLEEKRGQFYNAVIRSDETLSDYAMRLETLFGDAFPESAGPDATLWRRFMHSIPRAKRDRIKLRLGIQRLDEGRRGEPEWRDLLRVLLDDTLEVRTQCEERDREGTKEDPIQVWTVPGMDYRDESESERDYYQDHRKVDRDRNQEWTKIDSRRRHRENRDRVRAERQTRPGGDRREVQSSVAGRMRCFYCRRRGHTREECRRFLGACLLCGSRDHWVTRCPDRRELRREGPPSMNRGPPSLPHTAPKLHCHLCDAEGHVIEKCPDLVRARQSVLEGRSEGVSRTMEPHKGEQPVFSNGAVGYSSGFQEQGQAGTQVGYTGAQGYQGPLNF